LQAGRSFVIDTAPLDWKHAPHDILTTAGFDGGLQGPVVIFFLFVLLGGFLMAGSTLFFIIEAAVKSGMKSNQAESGTSVGKGKK
jgi:hypothetical protein